MSARWTPSTRTWTTRAYLPLAIDVAAGPRLASSQGMWFLLLLPCQSDPLETVALQWAASTPREKLRALCPEDARSTSPRDLPDAARPLSMSSIALGDGDIQAIVQTDRGPLEIRLRRTIGPPCIDTDSFEKAELERVDALVSSARMSLAAGHPHTALLLAEAARARLRRVPPDIAGHAARVTALLEFSRPLGPGP